MVAVSRRAHIAFEQCEPRQSQRIQHPQGFVRYFGADPVTWQNCNLHCVSMRPSRSLNSFRDAITSPRLSASR